MLKKLLIVCFLMIISVLKSGAQSGWIEQEQDISEEGEIENWQELYEELVVLSENPFNINTITKEQLEQLPFLSDKLIENILYYVYKYRPLLTKNELLGVEGMDRQTRHFLEDFIYIGPEKGDNKLNWRNILKYNKQEFSTRMDIPFNQKAGYADYPKEILDKYPNRKYNGTPFYHNVRYRFNYNNKIMFGFTAEKDSGEPHFTKLNSGMFDSYSGYLFIKSLGRFETIALGNYKAHFGYGLILNTGSSFFGSRTGTAVHRFGKGLSKYTSTAEGFYLQGVAVSYRLSEHWNMSLLYSYKKLDALVKEEFIKSLKTDGYHRTNSEIEKRNVINNQLEACNLSYKNTRFEVGLTAVYTYFNKMLNPDLKPYNTYYPRGTSFFNGGVYYKLFLKKFILSGETAFDREGRISTLNMISYSPTVYTSFSVINRYFDRGYQSMFANNSFCENSKLQNEAGIYIGMISNLLDGRFKMSGYVDIFHFFHRRYQVDQNHTSGVSFFGEISYSPSNSLNVLIRYSMKDKAKNYTDNKEKEKYVLPYIRQRLQCKLSYTPFQQLKLKADVQYVRSGYMEREVSHGILCGGSVDIIPKNFPVRAICSAAWFRTDNYDSRIYMYEPALLYVFSVPAFYGKGERIAIKAQYTCKKWLVIQMKYGYTHYRDRERIGTGTEEIQGNRKSDLQICLKLKW